MAEYTNRSVVRALSILEILLSATHGLLLGDIATRAALDRVTTFRLLRVLADRGYVARDVRSKRYSLMLNPVYFHTKAEFLAIAARLARAPLQQLHLEIGADVNVASYVGASIIYRRVNLGADQNGTDLRWSMLPSHATALGKVLLASRTQAEVRRVYEYMPLSRYTPVTIQTLSDLERELSRVSDRGYAVSECELDEDIVCLAVPIETMSKNCTLAISTCRPAKKESNLPTQRIVELMKSAAAMIAANLSSIPAA